MIECIEDNESVRRTLGYKRINEAKDYLKHTAIFAPQSGS
jgi:hypothetical protein